MTISPYAHPTYHVSGIVQMRVDGQWCEMPVSETVRCERRDQARDTALRQFERWVWRLYPQAVVRWHTPEMVRVGVMG